jgi:hypothetical protein
MAALWTIPVGKDEPDSCEWCVAFDRPDVQEGPCLVVTGLVLGRIAFEVVSVSSPDLARCLPPLTPTGFQLVAPDSHEDLLPSPTTARSTRDATGIPFDLRPVQIGQLMAEAGLAESLGRPPVPH